ncbi:MAG: EAL domain-containing protein [Pseudomonadota bacterium]
MSLFWLTSAPANALDAINVPLDVEALDLTRAADRFLDVGDRIQISTAPGLDGIVRRIEVRAREAGGPGNWAVFALTNTSDEQIDRLLVAPHFRLANSQIIWPDLGASRLVAVSPSQGFAPERLESQEADVFRITLDPGAVVTYVVELRTDTLPQLVLWDELAYRESVNATTLYKGIVLGIAGLLALFLTILFIVKRSAMFPAVAGFAWAVLAYLAIEFGFWNQIFNLQPGEEQVSRAIAEVVLAATLVLLLYAYLSLNAVHNAFFRASLVWTAFFFALIGLAVFEPEIASGVARMGLGVIGLAGLLVILPMSVQGFDRAVHLIPSWLILVAWLMAAWLAVSGHVVNDFVSPALSGGLVLVVLLLGFTVMQHAFAGGSMAEGLVTDSERKVLALSGSGDLVWDWDLAKDRVYSSPATEDILGLKRGSLAGPFHEWLSVIHPTERDHFRHVMEAVVEGGRGRVDQTFRMRAEDGHFRWFRMRARPVVADNEVFRMIGTMLDVTDMKTTQERLLRDAVNDSLTGLPNRELFLDRVSSAIERARQEEIARPTLIIVNIDHFSQHNASLGSSAADSLLTMVARRIDRLLKPNDTLSRFAGDQFGVLLLSEQHPQDIARITEQIRRALKAPMVFGSDEINLTASIGVATYDPAAERPDDVLRDAEIAMGHAKRMGGDRCEAFRPSLSDHGRSMVAVEADLRRALDRDELTMFYQPIIRLTDKTLVGFEALLRWNHPRHGRMAPAEFIPIAERSGLIIPVGLFVLERAARDLSLWRRNDANAAGLFTSVNVSSRQLLRHDLLNDLRAILARADMPGSALKLEITESLVMENPEYASQVLSRCRELGIGLSLDDFGTGYSSLSYLQRFPFDTIKIDQSFVKELDPGEPAVVLGAIVALGHDLGMEIVAEGIEDNQAARTLANLGCEFGQGYLFGRPIPASEVPGFLRDYAAGTSQKDMDEPIRLDEGAAPKPLRPANSSPARAVTSVPAAVALGATRPPLATSTAMASASIGQAAVSQAQLPPIPARPALDAQPLPTVHVANATVPQPPVVQTPPSQPPVVQPPAIKPPLLPPSHALPDLSNGSDDRVQNTKGNNGPGIKDGSGINDVNDGPLASASNGIVMRDVPTALSIPAGSDDGNEPQDTQTSVDALREPAPQRPLPAPDMSVSDGVAPASASATNGQASSERQANDGPETDVAPSSVAGQLPPQVPKTANPEPPSEAAKALSRLRERAAERAAAAAEQAANGPLATFRKRLQDSAANARADAAKSMGLKEDIEKQDGAKQDMAKQDMAKQDMAKTDTPARDDAAAAMGSESVIGSGAGTATNGGSVAGTATTVSQTPSILDAYRNSLLESSQTAKNGLSEPTIVSRTDNSTGGVTPEAKPKQNGTVSLDNGPSNDGLNGGRQKNGSHVYGPQRADDESRSKPENDGPASGRSEASNGGETIAQDEPVKDKPAQNKPTEEMSAYDVVINVLPEASSDMSNDPLTEGFKSSTKVFGKDLT